MLPRDNPALKYTVILGPESYGVVQAAVYGIDANLIDVEVDLHSVGSARDSRMVGMPDVAVGESRERIKSCSSEFRLRIPE